ncbi:MAG: small multi-drug export protein [Candidatus Kapaibacterium sp.]
MEFFLAILSVFAIALAELIAAIPAGIAMGLSPWTAGAVSLAGSIAGSFITIFLSGRVREWIIRRRAGKEKKAGRLRKFFDKYGAPGLGLSAPVLTGIPLGAALCVSFGASPGRSMLWMTAGVLLWSAILTGAALLGFSIFD